MSAARVAARITKGFLREPRTLTVILGVPIALVIIFRIAFGAEPHGTAIGHTIFDFMAHGAMLFGVLLLAPHAALHLAREREAGILERFHVAPISAATYLGGTALGLLVLASVAVVAMLSVSIAAGAKFDGSIPVAGLLLITSALSAIGIGLFIAAVARAPQEANGLAFLAVVILAMLSEAFFDIPPLASTAFGDRTVDIMDFIPTKHTMYVLAKVTTLGEPLMDYAWDVTMLTVLTLATLLLGLLAFFRRGAHVR